ncbi:hypothetical protein CALCODRAFT_485028 [Calocera cornea HHB12733]|uniref:Uncharacterized protein n=1 Tax=Calocera cornea HHB12733 TaxID=1353952 RepID=A0A165EL86_9BASI|nr:hypothetical protein CALCODRAFT_485028 [Calocera cornea HHB12733]
MAGRVKQEEGTYVIARDAIRRTFRCASHPRVSRSRSRLASQPLLLLAPMASSSTLIPGQVRLPLYHPSLPTPHPTPNPRYVWYRLGQRRDQASEADDLSDEENEVKSQLRAIRETGNTIFIPHGKLQTAFEESADREQEGDESDDELDVQDATLGSPQQAATPPEAGPLLQAAQIVPGGQDGQAVVDLAEWPDLDEEIEDLDAEEDEEGEEEEEEEEAEGDISYERAEEDDIGEEEGDLEDDEGLEDEEEAEEFEEGDESA